MNDLFIGGLTTGLDMVLLAVKIALLVWAIIGAILCARIPAGAFVAEGKWNKWGWFAVCVAGAVVFALFRPYSIFGVIFIVAVGVFYADVRPAVAGRR